MPRSLKKSITVPNPIREGLLAQIEDGTLDYPSENAAWIGLARYQLIVGKPHAITVAIARMHPEDQDVIDDFLLEVASRGLSLKGQFFGPLGQGSREWRRFARGNKKWAGLFRRSCSEWPRLGRRIQRG